MHRFKQHTTTFLLLMMLSAALLGCEEAQTDSGMTTAGATQKSTFDVVRDDVPQWLEFAAREQVESASLQDELQRSVRDLEALGLRHVQVLRTLYGVRSHRPGWVDVTTATSSGLTAPGDSLRALLREAETKHGLFAEDLHLATIDALSGGIERTEPSPFGEVRFEAAELKLVKEWARGNDEATPEELARALSQRDGPTPRLAELVAKRVETLQGSTRTSVRLDLFLSDALVEYGMQMRWSNPAWFREFDWPEHLEEAETDTRLGRDDLRRARRELLARRELMPVFDDPTKVAPMLATFVPPFEQYRRLSKSFAEYVETVEQGGWPRIADDAGTLQVGDESAHIVTLKERLAAEGYWKGDRSPKFTGSLAEALKQYQRTHQLWQKGELSRETRASLNVPAERRLAQIRVALQRWRESNIGNDTHYAFINIPDFHAEMWKDGERMMRFKTVTGSTKRERNAETGVVEYVHETPSVSSKIEHVVLNPYWWIPKDIAEQEILPEVEENPWYLVEHNYEWAEDDRGEATLRQKPGEGNALGRVKINFENPYQIYLHDTPEKTLFRWPARAFSHGCIRLHKPMEFAQYLLEQDGQWDETTVNTHLATGDEKWLKLQNPVPIHIEYYVVRVDDLGRANFLSDLYGRNNRRVSSSLARAREGVRDTAPVSTVE